MQKKRKISYPSSLSSIEGDLEKSLLDNVTGIGEIIEVAKKIDSARREFPVEIFNAMNTEEDIRLIIKHYLTPWFQEHFGTSVNIEFHYIEPNPTRRDSK